MEFRVSLVPCSDAEEAGGRRQEAGGRRRRCEQVNQKRRSSRVIHHEADPTTATDKYSPGAFPLALLCYGPNKSVQEQPSDEEREEGRGSEKEREPRGVQERGDGERWG